MWGKVYDLAVIGGGINGCGIARDAAGRGLSVFLAEAGDLGNGSSSASTKMVHGGLGLLDRFAFRDVRTALRERDLLLAAAPHAVRPLRFVMPHRGGRLQRAATQARLAIYGRLGGRSSLGRPAPVALGGDRAGPTLQADCVVGYEYSDCIADDSRLVILNAIDARVHGADIRPRVRCVVAEREGRLWRLAMEGDNGEPYAIAARTLVNAAGPWIPDVLDHVVDAHARPDLRLVKGSHIVVPKLYEHDRAYALRNADGRIVFVIPYLQDFTLVGTTEEDFHGDPAEVQADTAEIAYLIAAVSEYFRRPIDEGDVVWAWAGVGVQADPAGRGGGARSHVIEVEANGSQPPLVTVIGGAITTHRRLAEDVLERLAPFLKMGDKWTAGAALPGGLFPVDGLADLSRALRAGYPFLAQSHAARLAAAYGTRAQTIVSGARRMEDLGRLFGADLTEAEVRYLMAEEWAETADDILWRRSKLGLRLNAEEAADLAAWLGEAAIAGNRTGGARPLRAGAA
ncbi:MAG: glycerol-3-phosphate dehydrogenase [Bauldia sp.]|nr:glycerol-3-phosphate dehydrogenase [Bauldia sp.]